MPYYGRHEGKRAKSRMSTHMTSFTSCQRVKSKPSGKLPEPAT